MTTRALDIDREIADQQIPQSWQNLYRKALAGNRPAAVKVFCGYCQGWEDGARQAIRDCPSVGCPLHAVRPFQKKVDRIDDSEGIESLGGDGLNSPGRTDTVEGGSPMNPLSPRGFDLDDTKAKILDHLHRHGESQRGYIIFSSGIPESMWSEAIRTLLADGEVERQGEKRNTRYRLKESK